MTAFDEVWLFLKADFDFIEGNETPQEIAYKRMWLYNRLKDTPEENPNKYDKDGGWDEVPHWDKPDREDAHGGEENQTHRERYLDEYGRFTPSGQANSDEGYEQKTNWRGETSNDYNKPLFGDGRMLISLPNITQNVRFDMEEEYSKNNPSPPSLTRTPGYTHWMDMPSIDYDSDNWREQSKEQDRLRANNKIAERRHRRSQDAYNSQRESYLRDNEDIPIMDRIISIINHELGHTTQPEEEHEWTNKYAERGGEHYVGDQRRGGSVDDDISGIMRRILMQESLASIYEDPHNEDSDWKQKVAEYSSNSLDDHHDMQREVSHSMGKFYEENPDFYRSPEKVKKDKERLHRLIYGGDD